jgi:hypothetical protein
MTGADAWSPVATYTVHISNQPPIVSFANGPSQSSWHAAAQSIDITAATNGGSPIQSISCGLNGQPTTTYTGASAHITISSDGDHQLTCTAESVSGVVSASRSWQFLIDTQPPSGYIDQPDPQNPQQLAATVADTDSGVAGGTIQYGTADGNWISLPTSYDAQTGQLTATASDDNIPRGVYAVRVLVSDAVGNQATITAYSNGVAATHSVPARLATSLALAQSDRPAVTCSLKRVRLPATHVHVRLVRNQKKRSRMRRSCRTSWVPAPGHATLTLSSPKAARILGRLTTSAGQPIAGEQLAVTGTPAGWPTVILGAARTDATGDFAYTLPPGPSETVTVQFAGTKTIMDAAASTRIFVHGAARIAVTRQLRAGRWFTVSGRVLAPAYVPADGVLVQLRYEIRGNRGVGWAPFDGPVHTDSQGRWKVRFHLPTASRGLTYLLDALIASQTGWPYEQAITPTVARTVH